MLRLRRTLNRKDEKTGKEWDKWRIDVSSDEAEILKSLGWKDGDDLTLEVKNGKAVLGKKDH